MLGLDPDKNEEILKYLVRTLTYEQKEHLFSRYLLNEDDFSLPILDAQNNEVLDELRNNGIRTLGKVLSDQQVQDIHDYLSDKKVSLSHNPNYSATPETVRLEEAHKYSNFASYHMDTITKAPHLSELANSSWFIDLAKHYLRQIHFCII